VDKQYNLFKNTKYFLKKKQSTTNKKNVDNHVDN
jgi:hypothetical protein